MRQHTPDPCSNPAENVVRSELDQICQTGAKRMLELALEIEVETFLEKRQYVLDDEGRRLVVRNGYGKPRRVVTSSGAFDIRTPRVDDRVLDRMKEDRFRSKLIPPYLKRSSGIEAFIPFLYLKGISTGDFTEVMTRLTGEPVAGFSPEQIVRFKEVWQKEYDDWAARDLSSENYVYVWADGIHFNVRLEDDRTCILVVIGAKEDGTKDVLAITDGFRESKESWLAITRDLKRRGFKIPPKLAIADGALGFWSALEEEFPGTRHQPCWVHKTANVLDKLPKYLQPKAKQMLHEIYLAPTRMDGNVAFDVFIEEFEAKYPKAVKSLTDHREDLMTFYDFPAEHWQSIRSTNIIESTFATVRHRTRRTKGCGSRAATLMMVFQLCQSAKKRWRHINGQKRMLELSNGARFVDGRNVTEMSATAAAR